MVETILINYTGTKGGGNLDAFEMARGFKNNNVQVIAILSKKIENLYGL